ncbi:beta-ketoacyl-[acyl-carrier-protein] synthase family protein [Cohnella sp. REN36]|uniref:beta-ketoacyl-[acyl-carrier-protein] synthase family protein n=1 Tax=Cohnella sp. REN36 TaxID=2887347 RepID=UPI001D15C666|nr:beta-ketoacyl-[acyl-carrier-protein] synthase family protein [Cohnella sp. REN36]MCC3372467.1 beta-ketoacyl-[acyl-carrier-protein] synthase family protein [Cohnella sp. REN36]
MAEPKVNDSRVAVTGMGILCALGQTFPDVLAAMQEGRTGIGPVRRFPTTRLHSGIGAELRRNATEAYFTREQREKYDLCAQYAIIAADQALRDSGLQGDPAKEPVMGAALGTCNGGILSLEEQWTVTELDERRTARYPFYQQGDDVAEHLGLNGPVTTIHTACAASGNAIGFAYDMIRWGYADAMLAGGSDPLSHAVFAGFNVLRALSPAPASPFASRYGLSLGEGAAFVVLEPMDRAQKRGATIYAEICGYGLSNDAYHETAPDPEGRGIRKAVRMALRQSGTLPSQIGYINAHGTGTQANDQAEVQGLRGVFGDLLNHIPISSSKAYFGHTLGAAAAIEWTTSLYAIRHGLLPATLHYDEPRAGCEGLRIIANRMPPGRPDSFLNNNSAFGGHNASIVARTAPQPSVMDSGPETAEGVRERRIGIVGIGAVLGGEVRRGGVSGEDVSVPPPTGEEPGACTFSLKAFDSGLYERRMNRLCQFSIGAVQSALADAGWEERNGTTEDREIGLIYGTARGSTDSIGKFLQSVFENGPELASSIYFPHTVVNSVAGKTAEKLELDGFSSSLSTGGAEGILAAAYACGSIRSGVHDRFVIAAGEERSGLAKRIDRAKRLTDSAYPPLEGSIGLALADMDDARRAGRPVLAELSGFGLAFGGGGPGSPRAIDALTRAVDDALAQAGVTLEQVDGVLLDNPGRPGEAEALFEALRNPFAGRDIPLDSVNERWGYGESVGSMLLLGIAADRVKSGAMKQVLVVSASVNGNVAAAIVSQASSTSQEEETV